MCETCGEMKNVDEANTHTGGICGEMKNVYKAGTSSAKCTNLNFEKLANFNFEELEKNIESHVEEFERKIELGRQLKCFSSEYERSIEGL